jgi:hypothetical protein
MFLPSFLGVFCGYLAGTVSLLLYTHVRDKLRRAETEAYKQKLLDILQEPEPERIIVRRSGVPRTEN